MRKLFLLSAAVLILFPTIAEACTSLLVGKKASADGSTFISYAADSHVLYGELYHWPSATYPKGTMLDIIEWDTSKPLGKIAQVEKTYSVIGNMNEHQLTISESTWGGREELQDSTGIMDYGSLIYVTLQRAKTAREAIKTMTDLVKEYGYYSSGESFSIADPNEIWIMEMIGKGVGNKGAVWVAVKIPDECIAAHANHARIHTFPLDDKENCLYSSDVIAFAREKGYFNGLNKDFSFSKAYAVTDFGALRGCEARVWSFYNKYADGMDKYLDYINGKSQEVLPLYVKPNRKLGVRDVQSMMRDHFEDTPFDMTQDIGAGPFKVPYRYRPMTFKVDTVEYTNERAIATQQTGFSFVSQMRSWLPDAIGGILWFGVDDANTCVYVPMYCATQNVPECYKVGNGDMYTFSWTSAFWIHNWVANQAYNRYNLMIPDIRKAQRQLEDKYENMQPAIEKAAMELYNTNPQEAISYLNNYSVNEATAATASWKQLGEYLLVKFIDGNVKKEKDGKFARTPYGDAEYPNFPGYSKEYYEQIAKETGDRLKVTF
ncbi:MAG: C69 family dipeptidase [Bacteroidales bacterium]|nr:C69 family dipeptidase [Bacteroidales bacterium]